MSTLADMAAALVLTATAFWGLLTGTDVFEAMLDGIRQGLTTLLRILPPLIALLTAVYMLGSTETTFYVVAVYFGAAGVRRTRWAVPAALCADLAGFAASALAVRLFFG